MNRIHPRRGPISTLKRRMEFIEHLRTVGEGPECITWPWARSTRYASTVDDTGRQVSAHRWVYEQVHGPLNGLEACHTCDSPPCVRPSHLFAGTHGDNMRDAYQKGRKKATTTPRPGEAHHNARLTAEQVLTIRRLCAQGVPYPATAAVFGVSRVTISQIAHRQRWRHLAEESDQPTQAPATQA